MTRKVNSLEWAICADHALGSLHMHSRVTEADRIGVDRIVLVGTELNCIRRVRRIGPGPTGVGLVSAITATA
jgi:hypothetical protein